MKQTYSASLKIESAACIGTLSMLIPQVIEKDSNVFIIVDQNVQKLHQSTIDLFQAPKTHWFTQAISEDEKNPHTAIAVSEKLIAAEFPKQGYLVGIGGGVVCDLAGYVAMTYRRGIRFILVPTTLVAQVDAAVGGKNGLNSLDHKNIIGGFHYPAASVVDTRFLRSLDDLNFICGLAEMIKVFAVSDPDALHLLLRGLTESLRMEDLIESLVAKAISRKIQLLRADPLESSSARLLNFGHAFAHDLEEFCRFSLPHGIAVLIGMTTEVELARQLRLAPDDFLNHLQNSIVRLFHLSCVPFPKDFERLGEVIAKTRSARRGNANWVCPTGPGCAAIIKDIDVPVIELAWTNTKLMMS